MYMHTHISQIKGTNWYTHYIVVYSTHGYIHTLTYVCLQSAVVVGDGTDSVKYKGSPFFSGVKSITN